MYAQDQSKSSFLHFVTFRGSNLRGCIQNQIKKSEQKENGYTWKGNYFLEYLKASIADLITLLSSSVQNSEGGGDSGDGC